MNNDSLRKRRGRHFCVRPRRFMFRHLDLCLRRRAIHPSAAAVHDLKRRACKEYFVLFPSTSVISIYPNNSHDKRLHIPNRLKTALFLAGCKCKRNRRCAAIRYKTVLPLFRRDQFAFLYESKYPARKRKARYRHIPWQNIYPPAANAR